MQPQLGQKKAESLQQAELKQALFKVRAQSPAPCKRRPLRDCDTAPLPVQLPQRAKGRVVAFTPADRLEYTPGSCSESHRNESYRGAERIVGMTPRGRLLGC